MKLSSVLSDTSGITATKLINKLCEGKRIDMDDINEVYHKRIKATREELLEACNGYVTDHHIYLLQSIRDNSLNAETQIQKLNKRIKEVLSPYDNVLELLRQIPGLSTKTVEDLVAEIGLDMSVFPSEKYLSSWVGVSPGNNESAGKKKWTHHPRQQTGKNYPDRGGMGSQQN